MKRISVYQKCLYFALAATMILIGLFLFFNFKSKIPSSIKIMVGNEANFNFSIPASGEFYEENVDVMSVPINQKDFEKKESLVKQETKVKKVNLNHPFTVESNQAGNYIFHIKLFGLMDLKKVNVDVIEKQTAIPCGNQVGIYVETKGVLVLGTQSIEAFNGLNYEPAKNIVKSGDYITKINDSEIKNKSQLIKAVKENGEKPAVLELLRNDKKIKVKVKPVEVKENKEYKLGIWVRDDTQGIGTLTFISGDSFGALGHGINDADTGDLLQIEGGNIYDSSTVSIVKGKKGTPGEIVGAICYDEDNPLGSIDKNTPYGIFGTVSDKEKLTKENNAVEIGLKQDVKVGKAYIHSYISGKAEDYEIEITNVDASNKDSAKGMVIKMVDPRLLDMTNGIIQGMSGTPILQNGKLIGAVTHVFIQDSTKGYGAFIENMLKYSNAQ